MLPGKTKDPMISVIVPVFRTEQYVDRCLESICRQSYRDLEILVVDDGSDGNIREKIGSWKKKDNRIRLLTHEKNQGLFRARVTGVHAARGKYIAFVDSDDYVSSDYYHQMVISAEKNGSDIVIGKTVWDQQGDRFVYNLHEAAFSFDRLEGEEIQKAFFGQGASCYSWHTVWNKLYTRDLWEKALPVFDKTDGHIIMTEDILFSSVLFFYARILTVTLNDAYFYCINPEASTDASKTTITKYRKNLHDLTIVFDTVEKFLREQEAPEYCLEGYKRARALYARMWRNLPEQVFRGEDLAEARELIREFCPAETRAALKTDSFFSSIRTTWSGGLEYFKDEILSGKYKCISFDIFDTLLQRPVLDPSDVFRLMEIRFGELYRGNIPFINIRQEGEAAARRRMGREHPDWKDVTLTEIYREIGKQYGFPEELCSEMQKEEIRLEMELCTVRNAGRELFLTAKQKGIPVVLVTDMYLEKETIEALLRKNGLDGYKSLYVSSEARKLKGDGELFRYMLEKENLAPEQAVHIGDTWNSDIAGAENAGMAALFLPKARDVFFGRIQGRTVNSCGSLGELSGGRLQDQSERSRNLAYTSMLAMAANAYFDNPYRTFHSASDLNADPAFAGYYVLGMHLAGLVSWLIRAGKKAGYKGIGFLSRDGYLPLEAYRQVAEGREYLPKGTYVYTSRRCVLSGMASEKQDFFDLPVEFRNHTPESMLELLDFCVRDDLSGKEIQDIISSAGIDSRSRFDSREEYEWFIRLFLERLYSKEKHKESFELASSYYQEAFPAGTAAFDMGYSGRIQNAICRLCGYPVDVFFVHKDVQTAAFMSRKGSFQIHCMYDSVPEGSGMLREHIMSAPESGCIGFEKKDGRVIPVFDREERPESDTFVVNTLHRNALRFVKDWFGVFGAYMPVTDLSPEMVSAPYEAFLHCARDLDCRMFEGAYFEDTVYGGTVRQNVSDFIRRQQSSLYAKQNSNGEASASEWTPDNVYDMLLPVLNTKNKFVRGCILFLADRKMFRRKFSANWKKAMRRFRRKS